MEECYEKEARGYFLRSYWPVGSFRSAFRAPRYVAYDTDKKVTLKGTVTRWLWSNPILLSST